MTPTKFVIRFFFFPGPQQISRIAFKKLVSSEYAEILSLHPGEAYALQNLTRTDRLSLLLSGRAQVVSDRTTLHTIDANEFLDSPEFESSRASLEDKFRVRRGLFHFPFTLVVVHTHTHVDFAS